MRFLLLLIFVFSINEAYTQNGIWTWMRGSNLVNSIGNYGIQGVASPSNEPPALYGPATWTDLNGNFWILGGQSFTNTWETALWKYDVASNTWIWIKGPANTTTAGVYGVQGVPSPANYPGSRGYGCLCWTDQNGDLWLLGGSGADITGNVSDLNDLWRYTIATNEWTWMNGSSSVNAQASFGTFQVPTPTNSPPPRSESIVAWKDNQGDLWMYGGSLYDDVWRYTIATNTWTWMAGGNVQGAIPNYGIQQIASLTNTPGTRSVYANWLDQQGNLWLYGGYTNSSQLAGDIWKFDMTTYLWTWMAGTSQQPDTNFTFIQQCTPGGNPYSVFENRAFWKDDCGRFWNYGGAGYAVSSNLLWVFDPTTLQFTWVGGSGGSFNPANFGVQGVPAITNSPPSVVGATAFQTSNGDFWMFGGYDQLGPSNALWKYQPDPNCPVGIPTDASFTSSQASGCAPLSVQFSPQFTSLDSYQWNFGELFNTNDTSSLSNPSWTFNQPGNYTITLIGSSTSGCRLGSDTVSISLQLLPLPLISLGNDTALCENPFTLSLDAGNPGSTYQWNNGQTSQIVTVNYPDTFNVIVNNGTCIDSASIIVSSYENPELGDSLSLCQVINGLLLDAGINDASYQWSTGETNQTILVSEPGLYYVNVQKENCLLSDSVFIEGFSEGLYLYVPNTFSPDQNGLNEKFEIKGSGISDYRIQIYNRWGEKVYESRDIGMSWDGTVNSKPVQQDTYVYIIEYSVTCKNQRSFKKMGHVNLIR